MRPTAALQSVRKHLPSKQMLADSSFFGEGGDVEELFTTPSKKFFFVKLPTFLHQFFKYPMFADSFGCRMKCRIHQKVLDLGSYRGNLRTKDLLFLYASCQKKKENVSSLNVFSPWQCQQKTAKKFVSYFLVTKALGGQFREHNNIYRCKHLHFLRSA